MELYSIVLCAGKGTRMQSDLPKVIQRIAGYEMVNMVLKTLKDSGIENNNLILGYKKEEIIKSIDPNFSFNAIVQEEQLGTGDAVLQAKELLKDKEGITLVICGDTPLVTSETIDKLIKKHKSSKNDITILSANVDDPTGYGRIIRNDVDNVTRIIEENEADRHIKTIKEVNTGIYCFNNQKLFKYIDSIENNNAKKEYYLTDLVAIFTENNERVSGYVTTDNEEIIGVNDLLSLSRATKILHTRINRKLILSGVNIVDPDNTYIGPNVSIGKGTIIEPNNSIFGKSTIGKGNHIKSGNIIASSSIGDDCIIGPMAHLRSNAKIMSNCRIGNFVEIKNSTIGSNTKAAHLCYVGDAEVGENVNFGCGSITVNYDGVNKNKTIIEDNVFIGSNVNLIAPITIEKGSLIAAGTTVTDSVGEDKLVIGRNRQMVKERVKND